MHDGWTADDVDGFGRAVFEAVPEATRASWATRLLTICLAQVLCGPALGTSDVGLAS